MTTVKLDAATPREEIKQRQGPGGRTLDYIDARFVMDRLDAAVGPMNWQDKYEDLPNGSVRCGIGIRQEQGWVWKWDVGDVSDIEPVKGAHSDAFKRAAVKWGVARDLYGDHARPGEAPRTAQAPRQQPQRTPTPPAAVAPPTETEWDGIETIEQLAVKTFPDAIVSIEPDESVCPAHGKAWRTNSRGYYCSTKEQDGSWCKRQPSKAWQAKQELVTA